MRISSVGQDRVVTELKTDTIGKLENIALGYWQCLNECPVLHLTRKAHQSSFRNSLRNVYHMWPAAFGPESTEAARRSRVRVAQQWMARRSRALAALI